MQIFPGVHWRGASYESGVIKIYNFYLFWLLYLVNVDRQRDVDVVLTVQGYDNSESSVCKAAVFCLV